MRKTKLLFTLLLLLLTLTGCVRTGVGVIINEDCTGTVELSFGINKLLQLHDRRNRRGNVCRT